MSDDNPLNNSDIYKAVFDNAPVAIVLLNKSGEILAVNGRMEDWLGYKPEEIVGLNLLKVPFLSAAEKTKAVAKLGERFLGKEPEPYELVFNAKDDKELICQVNPVLVKSLNQDLVIISDITIQKMAQAELVAQNEQLERLNLQFVEREERIMELKEQINELKIKLAEVEKELDVVK